MGRETLVALIAASLIVIAVFALATYMEDNSDAEARCQSIHMVYDERLDACVEGVPVP